MFGLSRKKIQHDPWSCLLAVILWLTSRDALRVRDLLNGGVAIFGRTGSGKTSGSGRALAIGLVNYRRSGGLILAAKPEDREFWVKLFKEAGREADLIIFGPDEPHRFNLLEYESKVGGHAWNITRTLMVISETLRGSDSHSGGEDGQFWQQMQERVLYNAVVVVLLATGQVTAPDLQRFISNAAVRPEQLFSEEWQAGFHNRCLKAAYERPKTPIQTHDLQLAMDYWAIENPQMAEKTRSSILAGVYGILHLLNTGIVRELLNTTTTVSPDDMSNGRWVLVDMPPAQWGDIGRLVGSAWKLMTQRAVLRRHAKPGDCINVIWVDEAQQFTNSFDSQYMAQSRSHMGLSVFLTQALSSYYSAMKGPSGKHQVDALLANFGIKVFHALADVQTAQLASDLIGRSLKTFIGGSMQSDQDPFSTLMGGGGYTGNFSEQLQPRLEPHVFMNHLRTGGAANDFFCDAIVIRSGEPFASGENFLEVSFSQR